MIFSNNKIVNKIINTRIWGRVKYNNEAYKIFINRIYWLICLSMPLLLTAFLLVSKYVFNLTEISLIDIILGYISLVFVICIFTLVICVIIDIIKSFKKDNMRERIFIIVLLIIFTLKAVMEYLRSH